MRFVAFRSFLQITFSPQCFLLKSYVETESIFDKWRQKSTNKESRTVTAWWRQCGRNIQIYFLIVWSSMRINQIIRFRIYMSFPFRTTVFIVNENYWRYLEIWYVWCETINKETFSRKKKGSRIYLFIYAFCLVSCSIYFFALDRLGFIFSAFR